MNAITAQPASLPARAQVNFAKALTLTERPLDLLRPPWGHELFRSLCQDVGLAASLEFVSQARWRKCRELAGRCPAPAIAAEYAKAVEAVLAVPADTRAIAGMVGLLLDAYPSGRPPNLEAYADTIVHDLVALGHSPAVVALACREVRRSCKFLPSVAEVVAACAQAAEQWDTAARLARSWERMITGAHAVASMPEPSAYGPGGETGEGARPPTNPAAAR